MMPPQTAFCQQLRAWGRFSVSRRDGHINLKVLHAICEFIHRRLTKEKELIWITSPPLSYRASGEGKNIITACWLDLNCLVPSDNTLLWLSETSCHPVWKIRVTLNVIVLWKHSLATSPPKLRAVVQLLNVVKHVNMNSKQTVIRIHVSIQVFLCKLLSIKLKWVGRQRNYGAAENGNNRMTKAFTLTFKTRKINAYLLLVC